MALVAIPFEAMIVVKVADAVEVDDRPVHEQRKQHLLSKPRTVSNDTSWLT